jgi:precorrin-6B methylase 2
VQIKAASNFDDGILAGCFGFDVGAGRNDAVFVSRCLAGNLEQVVAIERRPNALHRIDPDVERIVADILDKIKNAELVVA